MPIGICPNCNKMIDIDGYVEHGVSTLFYCECGKVYDMIIFMELIEVPKEEVDLSNITNWPVSEHRYTTNQMSRGIFIKKSRWKKK